MKKKLISLFLVLALVVGICPVALAGETTLPETEGSSFLDGEGKVNTVYVSSENPGTAHVDYYIEGVLVNTVDAVLLNSDSIAKNATDDPAMVVITYTDVQDGITTQFTEPIVKYITLAPNKEIEQMAVTPRVSVYQGRINYKTCYDTDGSVYNDSLYIYQEEGQTVRRYETMNVAAGTAVSVAIGVISAVLTGYFTAPLILAQQLLIAAASSVGTTIVGGVVQGAIVKTYYVKRTYFTIKARDVKTARENTYEGSRYQVALDGTGNNTEYSSDYYYDGYMPWNSNDNAYLFFLDFWAYPYPGVKSYS